MIKNKKLLIGLVCLAFCVCCAIFGLGFKSKNLVAKADTISEPTVATAAATTAKSTGIAFDEVKEYQTVAQDPALDELEEIQIIPDEETFESEEPEEEIFEEVDSNDSENYKLSPAYKYVTFEGTVKWIDDYNEIHPLRQIKIQIDNFTTYTNDKGYFYLSEMFLPGTIIDIVAYAEDSKGNIQIRDENGEVYRHDLKRSFTILSLENNFQFIMGMNREGQAFQISQAVITARDFAQEMMGRLPSPVQVVYPSDKKKCCYTRDERTIHILQVFTSDIFHIKYPHSYASWDMIMHEYGHHIQYELGIIDSPHEDHFSDKNDADELKNKDKGIRLAWAESWPTVFGMIAQKYYVEKGVLFGIRTVGDSYYTAYNTVNFDVNSGAEKKGEACEQSIMAVLWDLFDDDDEINDTIALGYQGFWDVTTKNGTTTFSKFIEVFYDTYSELMSDIGANLSYYKMTAYDFSVDYVSLNSYPPTFSWQGGGGSDIYYNNYFDIIFYDANNKRILMDLVPSLTVKTLTADQWNKVLNADGDYFYWAVSAKNIYVSDATTGPYYSARMKIQKPYTDISDNIVVLTLGLNRHFQITNEGDYWFKFVAPESGTYTFYTESGLSDTYGEVYRQLFHYEECLITSDDNSGDGYNFKITLFLQKNACVYIRVKTIKFQGHYDMRVKQE